MGFSHGRGAEGSAFMPLRNDLAAGIHIGVPVLAGEVKRGAASPLGSLVVFGLVHLCLSGAMKVLGKPDGPERMVG